MSDKNKNCFVDALEEINPYTREAGIERKLELVKLVLEYIVKNQQDDRTITAASIRIDGYGQEEVYHTVRLLEGAGFILMFANDLCRQNYYPSYQMDKVNVRTLTWEGYEFLSNTREPSVWQTAKKVAGGFSMKVVSQILEKLVMRHAETALQSLLVLPGNL